MTRPPDSPPGPVFTIRPAGGKRAAGDPYWYDVFEGDHLIARYWHDHRDEGNGIAFVGGPSEEFPTNGSSCSFFHGDGPEPLRLTAAAIAYLTRMTDPNGRKPPPDGSRRPLGLLLATLKRDRQR